MNRVDRYQSGRAPGDIVVTGPSGAGKNFLLDGLVLPPNVRIVNVGDSLNRHLHKRDPRYWNTSKTKDGIRNSGDLFFIVDGLLEVLNLSIDEAIAQNEILVFNAHMTYEHADARGTVSEAWTYQRNLRRTPRVFIHIRRDPVEIHRVRQEKAGARQRPDESLEDIVKRQEYSYAQTRYAAEGVDALFVPIDNRADNVDENRAKISQVIFEAIQENE